MLQATNANKQPVKHHRFYVWTGWMMGKLGLLVARMDLQKPLHIPDDRPILFAGNHRSFFDFVMTMAIFSREGISCRILVRASLFNNPFMGWFLHRWGAIPLSSRVREQAEDTAAAALAAGQMVAIMPEGKLMLASDRNGRKVGEPQAGCRASRPSDRRDHPARRLLQHRRCLAGGFTAVAEARTAPAHQDPSG